jgi:hypothetical protein
VRRIVQSTSHAGSGRPCEENAAVRVAILTPIIVASAMRKLAVRSMHVRWQSFNRLRLAVFQSLALDHAVRAGDFR